jgi:hypothetical protein
MQASIAPHIRDIHSSKIQACGKHQSGSNFYTARAAPHSQSVASFQMKAAAEKPKQADDNQIDGNDKIQQPRHNQNENASDERNKRADTQVKIHGASFFLHVKCRQGT